ncbi:MAG: rhodanese-like domain-containing protein [Bacteroidetes bacterium]|nr:rhodanese-like domain-containing protein [Bacteroidota bacterium]
MKKGLQLLALALVIGIQACGGQTGEEASQESTETAPAQETPAQEAQPKAAFTDIDVATFNKLITDDVIILDVRTPEETAKGKVPEALEANVLDQAAFEKGIENLDPNQTYLVYCRSGRRSVTACNQLAKKGFTNLYNLQGGYNAWSAE